MLNKAIDIQESCQDIFYSKPFAYQVYKVELLLELEMYSETKLLLDYLNSITDREEISDRFIHAIANTRLAQVLHEKQKAKTFFDKAFSLLKVSEMDIEHVQIKGLKPFISFETIDGLLVMGIFIRKVID